MFFFFFKYKFIPVEHESSSGEAPENNFSFAKWPAKDLIFLSFNYLCFMRKTHQIVINAAGSNHT